MPDARPGESRRSAGGPAGNEWRPPAGGRAELYGTATCPYTAELRDWLEWNGRAFVEYDVEADTGARERLRALAGGERTVPVLVEDGRVVQVGWQGRGCIVDPKDGR